MNEPSTSPAGRLRNLLKRSGMIRSLAAHDVFTARIMERAGLELIFLGGFGVSASMLGLPDLNLLTVTEMADAARRTTARVSIPVVVDGDTGHGDVHQVQRTVRLFEQAGAAGVLLEDQVMPKRCGHFASKQVVSRSIFLDRIRAAAEARSHPDFLIFARSDARSTLGLSEAIARVNEAADVGADVSFVEAPETVEELRTVAKESVLPAMANMLTGGVTPIVDLNGLEAMGFKIGVAPVESLMVCARAVEDLCASWLKRGRVDDLAGEAKSFAALKKLLEVEEMIEMQSRGSDSSTSSSGNGG